MEKDLIERLSGMVNFKKKEIITFAIELVKTLSENPPGNEIAVAELIKKQALEWGLAKPEIISEKDNRPNLIFTFKGIKKGRILVINGHIDTKPIGDITKWTIDPYNPRIIDGKLYGPGSADMKGAIVGMLAAAMIIMKNKILLNGDLILALAADEEAGSVYGAKVLIEKGLNCDAILVTEPSGVEKNFDSIGIACRGAVLGKIVVHGTRMHSSLSDKGNCVNASIKMAKVLIEFAENFKKQMHYKCHYLYPNGPTVNPGVTIDGGKLYGVIPDTASFGFDIRVIPGMTLEGVKKDIENFLNKLKERDKDLQAELVLEPFPKTCWAAPAEISSDHPLVSSCIKAVKTIIGIEPKLIGIPFGSDAEFFANELKIATISSFGPGLIKQAHAPDEYVKAKAILNAAKIFAITAVEYLNY